MLWHSYDILKGLLDLFSFTRRQIQIREHFFPLVQPRLRVHKWRLAPVFCHGGFVVPFGLGLLDASPLHPGRSNQQMPLKRCGHHAAKPPHAVFYIIPNILNHLHVDTFRWRDVPEVTIIIIISQTRIVAGTLRVFIQTFKGCDDGNFYRPSNQSCLQLQAESNP